MLYMVSVSTFNNIVASELNLFTVVCFLCSDLKTGPQTSLADSNSTMPSHCFSQKAIAVAALLHLSFTLHEHGEGELHLCLFMAGQFFLQSKKWQTLVSAGE